MTSPKTPSTPARYTNMLAAMLVSYPGYRSWCAYHTVVHSPQKTGCLFSAAIALSIDGVGVGQAASSSSWDETGRDQR